MNFVYIVVFDVEIVLENAKIAILERLELQIFCHPNHGGGKKWGQIRKFSSGTFSNILPEPNCHLCKL